MSALEKQVKNLLDGVLRYALGNIGGAMTGSVSQKKAFPGGDVELKLPRSSPESQGLSSKNLKTFFDEAAETDGANLHTLMVIKGGKVVAEGSFAPYKANMWQVSHSLCKTMVGTAVGFAFSEGLFSKEDSVVSFFEEKTNIFQRQIYKNLTVEHLLTMSSGVTFNEISEVFTSNWISSYFSSIMGFKPGSKFSYNSMNSFMLAAIISKTSGQNLMDYLQPRLFTPLGFGPITWEKSPEGIEKGGWGMYIMPEDIAKLGLLYLNNGQITIKGETKQILPLGWAEDATQRHIVSDDGADEYGYQIWTDSKANTFCMNGIFGQYAFGIPDEDILIVAISGAKNFFRKSGFYTLINRHFVGGNFPKSRFFAPFSRFKLNKTLRTLKFAKTAKTDLSKIDSEAELAPFLNKTWVFPENYAGILPIIFQGMNNNFAKGIRSARFEQSGRCIKMIFVQENVTKSISIGINAPVESTVLLGNETYFLGNTAFFRKAEGETKLVFELCFLECTSARYIEISLIGENVVFKFYEMPDILEAFETAGSSRGNVTLIDVSSISAPIVDFINKNDFIRLKKEDFFKPTIMGEKAE